MMKLRHELSLDLEVMTPLRVSSGDEGEVERQDADGNAALTVVETDVDQNVVIPSSSLKGGLRALLADFDANELFGTISLHREGGGQIGRLWFADAIGPKAETCVFAKQGIALDPDFATVAATKFFRREFVDTGTRFRLAFTWFGGIWREPGQIDSYLSQVLAALNSGFALGGSRSKGAGRLGGDLATLRIQRGALDAQGYLRLEELEPLKVAEVTAAVSRLAPPETKRQRVDLKLTCDGPFMSRDGACEVPHGDTTRKVGMPLMRGGKCALWPESLAGALRARATWAANLNPGALDGDPDKVVDRLFGTTKARARLWVEKLECTRQGDPLELTSISIDRVTGGGREGRLYSVRPYLDPVFEAVLSVLVDLDPMERKLLELLKAELEFGIELGHGGAKGFGWFDVEWKDREIPRDAA